MLFYILALVATFFSAVSAHMTLASPVPFGDPTTSPLSSDGSNFPCQVTGDAATFYKSTADSANNTMAIGETQTLSFHGSAVHGGGSCQLALTSDLAPTSSSVWQVILSMEGGCPTTDGSGPSTYDYTIPSSIAAGKYVFAWTWISKLSGAPEYYMNCAPVTVTGSSSKREAAVSDVDVDVDVDVEARDTSSLPNLFVANLASINSCKTTTSTDVVFPDPGPNVVKPSKMTTNFQSPAGDNCFPLGGSSSSGGSGSSASASGSGSASAAPAAASSAPAAKSGGGVFVTVSTPAADTTAAAATTAVATTAEATTAVATSAPATSAAATTTPAAATSAAPTTTPAAATTSAAGNGTTSGSSGGSVLSGSCTTEGIFNCVGGTQYQQCASGTWTALRPMAAGTTCQSGLSNTLWARARNARFRRARLV